MSIFTSTTYDTTEDTETDDPNIECTAHSDCDAGSFCSVECFTGDCGPNGDIPSGTLGQFCQPCVECEQGTDSITGDCDVCE
jgi:hypothetical protein